MGVPQKTKIISDWGFFYLKKAKNKENASQREDFHTAECSFFPKGPPDQLYAPQPKIS
jgi:hypothetical protein